MRATLALNGLMGYLERVNIILFEKNLKSEDFAVYIHISIF